MADDFQTHSLMGGQQGGTRTARSLLTRRLADIVCLPSSRVSPQERWIVADVLDEMLRTAEPELRRRVAERLAEQGEAPPQLLRRLALDSYDIAAPILERSQALTDFDMMEIAGKGDLKHRIALARRERCTETVSAALAASGDPQVIEVLLRNDGVRLAPQTMDHLVRMAADHLTIAKLVIKRPELRPAQAFALFWDVDHDRRRLILERFAVARAILQDAASDVFPAAAREAEPDRLVARALAYIDRRQRDRKANDTSSYGGLEGVVEQGVKGLTPELIAEAARLANVQPSVIERIVEDLGGEGLGVFAKATGLSRRHMNYLRLGAGHGDGTPAADRVEFVFDTLSVDKAQTVLRYWDWSFRRAEAPA